MTSHQAAPLTSEGCRMRAGREGACGEGGRTSCSGPHTGPRLGLLLLGARGEGGGSFRRIPEKLRFCAGHFIRITPKCNMRIP